MVSDDIVTRLREDFCDFGQWENSCTPEGKCPCCLAADEIERLRKLAYLLIEELRFNGGYEAYTPKMLFDEFYEQAVRGE